jgi:hypothetical protein
MDQNSIRHLLQTILDSYVPARTTQPFAGNPIRSDFKNLEHLLELILSNSATSELNVKWSIGKGSWANIPWVAVLDTRETDTTQHGIYCSFLFCQDMSGFYLSFDQGITSLIKEKGKIAAYEMLRSRAEEIRKSCSSLVQQGFKLDETIDLKADALRSNNYEISAICIDQNEGEIKKTSFLCNFRGGFAKWCYFSFQHHADQYRNFGNCS